jgi:hypothetical protein
VNYVYVYDGDGNRVSEIVGGATTKYVVDTVNPTGYAQVVDELRNGALVRTYSYGLERIRRVARPLISLTVPTKRMPRSSRKLRRAGTTNACIRVSIKRLALEMKSSTSLH